MGSSESKGKRNCTLDNRATKEFRRKVGTPPHRIRVMRELMRANRDKVGAPFQHPDCIIEWIMKVKAKNKSSYRDVVGDVEDKLLAMGLPPLSHSQLYERSRILFESAVKTTDVCDARVLAFGSFPAEGGKDVTAALDASGFSLNKYGGWIFYKWNREPVTGWVKLHAMVDVETQMLLSYVVTDEMLRSGQDLDVSYEYYIILEETQANTAFVRTGEQVDVRKAAAQLRLTDGVSATSSEIQSAGTGKKTDESAVAKNATAAPAAENTEAPAEAKAE